MAIRNTSRNTFLRLTDEDKTLLEIMARYYGITQADIIRIAIKEFAKNHGFYIDKVRHELFATNREVTSQASS